MKRYFLLLLGFSLLWVSCRNTNPDRSKQIAEFRGRTMGTTFVVKAVLSGPICPDPVKQRIEETLKRINSLMSTYQTDSELSGFNRAKAGSWFPVEPETMRVFEVALGVGSQSGGALDITVGPLVNLWGFGPEKRHVVLPTEGEIAAAIAMTGLSKLKLQKDPPALLKEQDGLYCDLSAVAKGYGVDRVLENLMGMGIKSCMVEIGGEVRVVGLKPDGAPWRIGVAVPDGSNQVFRAFDVTDMALATSGDYQNYYEVEGKRFSHTIDPSSGRPIVHKLASVTILLPACVEADAWATALDVLGPEKGMALADELNLPALFIVREADGFVERSSRAMKRFIKE
jgi:thiamine biosynthesis lipoprotein